MKIRHCRWLYLALVVGWFVGGRAAVSQTRTLPRAPRVPLPVFTPDETAGIFFEDLFAELPEARPERSVVGGASESPSPETVTGSAADPESKLPGQVPRWSTIISATTLVDEIKATSNRLEQEVRTPGSLSGRTAQSVRQDLAMLAFLFGIVEAYDDQAIRFRSSAAAARDRLAETADSLAAWDGKNRPLMFRRVRARQEDLQQVLSGSTLLAGDAVAATWPQLAARSPLMQRLEVGLRDRLALSTRDAAAASSEAEAINHEAQIAAAIGEALLQPDADDSDDPEYADLAKALIEAAREIGVKVEQQDYVGLRAAVDRLGRSCIDCHEQFR